MEYLGGPSVFYQPNDAEVDTVPNFKVKEEPDQDTNKQLELKDKRLESKTEEATTKELTVKNIKSEPGISYTTTEEEIDTAGLNGPTLKIESLSEVWDWDPNDETKTAASSETTIRIESVSGATVSNKDIDSGALTETTIQIKTEPGISDLGELSKTGEFQLKTEELDISDYECENDPREGSSWPESKPRGRFETIKTKRRDRTEQTSAALLAKNFRCALCLGTFANKKTLAEHVTSVCFRSLSPRSKRELKRRLAARDDVQFAGVDRLRRSKSLRCVACRIAFATDAALKAHKVVAHPKLLTHRCEVCGKAFAKNSYMMRHLRIHTEAGRVHRCETCDVVFTESFDLKRHNRLAHPEKRPYKCEHCDKRFFRSCHRSRHLNIHTQKIAYECKTCGQKFTQGSNLNSHMLIHADIRRYSCETCHKKFRQASDLKKHVLVHTGERAYGCRTCDKPFQTISSRNHHERIHSDVRNFVCGICSRAFVSNCHLKRHSNVHVREKNRTKVVRRKRRKKAAQDEECAEVEQLEDIGKRKNMMEVKFETDATETVAATTDKSYEMDRAIL